MIKYFCQLWAYIAVKTIPIGVNFLLGGGFEDKSKVVGVRKVQQPHLVDDLCARHREADTRVFLHCYHAGIH